MRKTNAVRKEPEFLKIEIVAPDSIINRCSRCAFKQDLQRCEITRCYAQDKKGKSIFYIFQEVL